MLSRRTRVQRTVRSRRTRHRYHHSTGLSRVTVTSCWTVFTRPLLNLVLVTSTWTRNWVGTSCWTEVANGTVIVVGSVCDLARRAVVALPARPRLVGVCRPLTVIPGGASDTQRFLRCLPHVRHGPSRAWSGRSGAFCTVVTGGTLAGVGIWLAGTSITVVARVTWSSRSRHTVLVAILTVRTLQRIWRTHRAVTSWPALSTCVVAIGAGAFGERVVPKVNGCGGRGTSSTVPPGITWTTCCIHAISFTVLSRGTRQTVEVIIHAVVRVVRSFRARELVRVPRTSGTVVAARTHLVSVRLGSRDTEVAGRTQGTLGLSRALTVRTCFTRNGFGGSSWAEVA